VEARLYDQVADRVADLIARGALRPGDRVPSVRELARQERVSVATVIQAYVQLESRGLVEVRPQSGHYVRRSGSTLPEPRPARPTTVAIKPAVAPLIAKVYRAVRDPRIVNLGAAFPSPELLPTEKLNRLLSQIAKTAGGAGVIYDPPPGCPALRRQVARRMVQVGCPITADEIVTTVGAMEALDVALRAVTKPGDTIAIESPAYYGLLLLIESLGIKAIEIPSHARTGMDLDALEDALRLHPIAAVMAIPSFNNPLGSRMPDEAKARMVAILSARSIPLIEDDIYGDLPFPSHEGPDDRPRPAKAWDRDGGVILCSSFSKTIAPGYRVGWVAGGRFRDAIEQIKFAQTVATPTLTQLAVAELIETGGYDTHLRRLRRALASQVARTREAIAAHFPEGTRVSDPTGGFVLWVELPAGVSSIELHARALERSISVAPGPIFSAKSRFSNYLRISCGLPWAPKVEAAMATLGKIACDLSGRAPA
jgi:DNA-binding transcriptional MocR family regulator